MEERKKLSTYNERGEEIPDSTPMALPIDFTKPLPLGERIKRLVASEVFKREMAEKGMETFDEADDFDVPEDPVDASPYEETFDPLHTTAREQEIRAGFVEDIAPERKEHAREVVAKARRGRAKKAGAKADVSDSGGVAKSETEPE